MKCSPRCCSLVLLLTLVGGIVMAARGTALAEGPDPSVMQAQDKDSASASTGYVHPEFPEPLTEKFCRKARRKARADDHPTEDEPFPLYRVPPLWPEAKARPESGHVVIEFTIRSDGRTGDIRAVESSSGVFENRAIQAASTWRYCPVFKGGSPIETRGVTARLEFPCSGWEPVVSLCCNVSFPEHGRDGDYVVVEFTVGTDGRARNIEIVESSNPKIHDHMVRLVRMRPWHFKPSCVDGKLEAHRQRTRINLFLESPGPE